MGNIEHLSENIQCMSAMIVALGSAGTFELITDGDLVLPAVEIL